MEAPGLGLAYEVPPVVEAVAPDSPAAKAGLKSWARPDRTIKLKIPPAEPDPKEKKEKGKATEETVELDEKGAGWPAAFGLFQRMPAGTEFSVLKKGAKEAVRVVPEADPTWFEPGTAGASGRPGLPTAPCRSRSARPWRAACGPRPTR